MANPTNSFSLTGVIVKDVHLSYAKTGSLRADFTISVIDSIRHKPNYITCMAVKKSAERCALFCLKGNVVSVSGEIFSEEQEDLNSGVVHTKIFFLVYDIMPIIRVQKTKLNKTSLKNIIKTFED